jgi:hypothetical protein
VTRRSIPALLIVTGIFVSAGHAQEVKMLFPPEIFPNPKRDIVKLDPGHYRVEFENDKVRVVRAELKPDEISPMHDDPESLLICPVECHIRFTYPDRKLQDVHMAAGESRWVYDGTRSHKNLSNKPAILLFVETKVSQDSHH